MQNKEETWYVYILLCSNMAYYVGMSKNVWERFKMHQDSRGAEFTSRFRPEKILWQEKHSSREMAHQREIQIKGWSRKKKEALISGII